MYILKIVSYFIFLMSLLLNLEAKNNKSPTCPHEPEYGKSIEEKCLKFDHLFQEEFSKAQINLILRSTKGLCCIRESQVFS